MGGTAALHKNLYILHAIKLKALRANNFLIKWLFWILDYLGMLYFSLSDSLLFTTWYKIIICYKFKN